MVAGKWGGRQPAEEAFELLVLQMLLRNCSSVHQADEFGVQTSETVRCALGKRLNLGVDAVQNLGVSQSS